MLKKHFLLLLILKKVVLLNFGENHDYFFQDSLINRKLPENKTVFQIEIFCNNINIFVSFCNFYALLD